MRAEDSEPGTQPQTSPHEDRREESLTDLIDRMDREAFRRALEQRDLRVLSTRLKVR